MSFKQLVVKWEGVVLPSKPAIIAQWIQPQEKCDPRRDYECFACIMSTKICVCVIQREIHQNVINFYLIFVKSSENFIREVLHDCNFSVPGLTVVRRAVIGWSNCSIVGAEQVQSWCKVKLTCWIWICLDLSLNCQAPRGARIWNVCTLWAGQLASKGRYRSRCSGWWWLVSSSTTVLGENDSYTVASFTKEVNSRLAKHPLVFNGRFANLPCHWYAVWRQHIVLSLLVVTLPLTGLVL